MLGGGCADMKQTRQIMPAASKYITAEDMLPHLRVLASPELGGRVTGTQGCEQAAEYIAAQFADIGLHGAGPDGEFSQRFPVGTIRAPGAVSMLTARGRNYRLGTEFSPMAIGSTGAFSGRLIFAGYGTNNDQQNYDDFQGVRLAGNVVMLLQAEPHTMDGKSLWSRTGWSRRSDLEWKLKRLADAGATAALVVTPPDVAAGFDPIFNVIPGRMGAALPAMRLSLPAANRLLRQAGREEHISDLVLRIRHTGRPSSFQTDLELRGQIDMTPGISRNVLGYLPAPSKVDPLHQTPPARPTILLTAHYDGISPLGYGGAKDRGFGVRPGANDNASGVAMLLQIARALADTPERKCNYVFAALTGSEVGFVGARHYLAHPPVPPADTAVVVNLDQVGRSVDRTVYVIGDSLREPYKARLQAANKLFGVLRMVRMPQTAEIYDSDDVVFRAADMPTLFFFGGFSPDFHRTGDTIEKLNLDGMEQIGKLVLATVLSLDDHFGPTPRKRPDEPSGKPKAEDIEYRRLREPSEDPFGDLVDDIVTPILPD
jgi:hypothetical protein